MAEYNKFPNLVGRVDDIERRLRDQETAPRLSAAGVGFGGITIHDGGSLTVDDGGSIVVKNEVVGTTMTLIDGRIEILPKDGDIPAVIETSHTYGPPFEGVDFTITPPALPGSPITPGEAFLRFTNTVLEPDKSYFEVQANGSASLGSNNGSITLFAGTYINVNSSLSTNIISPQLFLGDGSDTALTYIGSVGYSTVYIRHTTTGASANCVINAADGNILRSTSSLRYKQDVEDLELLPEDVLKLRPRKWRDRREVGLNPDTEQHYVGFIAEELDEAGLKCFVLYDEEGRPDAISYDRISAALVTLAQDQQAKIDDLRSEMDELKAQFAELKALVTPAE